MAQTRSQNPKQQVLKKNYTLRKINEYFSILSTCKNDKKSSDFQISKK